MRADTLFVCFDKEKIDRWRAKRKNAPGGGQVMGIKIGGIIFPMSQDAARSMAREVRFIQARRDRVAEAIEIDNTVGRRRDAGLSEDLRETTPGGARDFSVWPPMSQDKRTGTRDPSESVRKLSMNRDLHRTAEAARLSRRMHNVSFDDLRPPQGRDVDFP